MGFPQDQLTNPWVDGEGLNSAKMFARTTQPLNTLAAAFGFGYIGDNISGTSVTLAGTTDTAGTTSVTFNLTSQRRVLMLVLARYQIASAAGRMALQAGYNSGATVSIGSVSKIGATFFVQATTAGTNGTASGVSFGSVLLAAGQYTAYPVCTRLNGTVTDLANSFGIVVLDVGAN